MLKITMHETPLQITLKLEGSLRGAWVSELEDVWRTAVLNGTGRAVSVDLSAVIGFDAAGRYLLILIHERGAQIIGSGGRILDDLIEVVDSWPLKMDP